MDLKFGLCVVLWCVTLLVQVWIVIKILGYVAYLVGLTGLWYWLFTLVGTVWCLNLIGTFEKKSRALDDLMKNNDGE